MSLRAEIAGIIRKEARNKVSYRCSSAVAGNPDFEFCPAGVIGIDVFLHETEYFITGRFKAFMYTAFTNSKIAYPLCSVTVTARYNSKQSISIAFGISNLLLADNYTD